MKRDKIELLSPAGSFDALVAAVQNGADAVYLGGREFNARINADNFSLPEMKKAIDYCHIRGVRVYAAVNTLVPDDRFSDALEYVRKAYLLGIDAVIVQDVGLASALMRIFPDLPIHASTQMTVHNSDGACLLKDMGFERMILSREVSLENIRRIKEKAKVILECFCHGAICISYSGQCLMSSFMFGRSGNRGVCAQPCRLKYSLAKGPSEVSKQSYMLSPRDLCTIKAVDKIGEAGVDTIKIEGRMRSPEYVACVTDAYREGIDKGFVDAEKISGLSKVFNRGFCGGFVLGDKRGFINDIRQNNQGLYIGCCLSYDRKVKLMRMRLEENLCVGDGLRIDSGDDEIGCKVKSIAIGKKIVKEAGKGDTVSLKVDKIVAESSPVYKTFDKKADAWAKGTYLKGKEIRKVSVDIKVRLKDGEPLFLEMSDGVNSVCSESSVSAEKAVKHAMTYEKLKEQFSRLGNTPFSIRKFVFDVDEGLMIPLSKIGRVRKEAVRKLEEMRSSVSRRMDDKTFTDMASKTMAVSRRKAKIKRTKISVHVGHMDVLKEVLGSPADEIIIGNGFNSKENMDLAEASELVKESGKTLVFATPAILTDSEVNEMLGVVQRLRPEAVLVSNIGMLKALVDSKDVESEIHLDYPLNVYNTYSVKTLVSIDKKIRRVCVSVELPFEKVRKMSIPDTEVECVVHGRLPVMTSEHCIFSKKCLHQCEKGYEIVDRLRMKFPVKGVYGCRMQILNCKILSLIKQMNEFSGVLDCVRLDLRDVSDISSIVEAYRNSLDGKKFESFGLVGKEFTRGLLF